MTVTESAGTSTDGRVGPAVGTGPTVRHRVVSADAHVLEPPHIWERWLPSRFQDAAPRLTRDSEGGDAWLFAGSAEPDPLGLTATPGMPRDQFRWKGGACDGARGGSYAGVARLADMDLDGVQAEILFPPQRTIGHFLGSDDDELVRAGIDAYNEFLHEEFCAPDRDRLVGAAQMPSTGVDDCVRSLQDAVGRGFRTVVISNWPSGGDSVTDADDAFWAAAAEAGVPVCIHINLISRSARQRARAAAARQGGRGLYAEGGAARAGAKAAAGLAGVLSMVPGWLGQMLFTGVFERFHDLHVCMVETGVGWLPHFLEQADDRYWRTRSWTDLPISEPPSTYWSSNMSATFVRDDNGLRNRHEIGVDNMMWSTDYPHHGNDWPYSRRVIAETTAGMPVDERDRIVAGNAVRIFGLPA